MLPRRALSNAINVIVISVFFFALGAGRIGAHEWNGLALDERGNLYTIDAEDGQVWRVTPAGEVSVFVPGEKALVMNHPHHLARDRQGAFWLASG